MESFEALLIALPLILAAVAFLLVPLIVAGGGSQGPMETDIAQATFAPPQNRKLSGLVFGPADCVLSLVVPAYNEEYRLPQMLDETLSYLERRRKDHQDFNYEVIVVDDGSTDNTYATAAGIARSKADQDPSAGPVRVMKLTQNQGKGFAVQVGMLAARGQWALMVDADGATRIRDLERLEEKVRFHKVPIAFGSRHHLADEAVATRAWYRNVLMFAFHVVVRLLVGSAVQYTQCGFKLFSRDAARRIFSSMHLRRWAFDIEVLLLASHLSLGIVEVPVTWTEIPGSKLNLIVGALQMLRDIAAVRLLYMFKIWRPAAVATLAA